MELMLALKVQRENEKATMLKMKIQNRQVYSLGILTRSKPGAAKMNLIQ